MDQLLEDLRQCKDPQSIVDFPELKPEYLEQLSTFQPKGDVVNCVISTLNQNKSSLHYSNLREDRITQPGLTVQTKSNYPFTEIGSKDKVGQPTADAYCVWRCANFMVFCVCDGCGWGQDSSYVARVASAVFVSYMQKYIQENENAMTTKSMIEHVKKAVAIAHQIGSTTYFIQGKNIGSCTLCGGVVVPLVPEEELKGLQVNESDMVDSKSALRHRVDEYKHTTKTDKMTEKYQYIGVSVGDCKAYFVDRSLPKHNCVDLTYGSRLKSKIGNDPGGRIGKTKEELTKMDLRNGIYFAQMMHWNDYLIVCSDGIHDNLEPKTRGMSVEEVLPTKKGVKWNALTSEDVELINKNYSLAFLEEMESHAVSVHQFHQIIMDSVEGVVKDIRDFSEKYPLEAIPSQFSGKLDHATLLVARPAM
ncbi:hypothetical protein EIN_053430 [Entamoeba invadens IP1]|uniref:hypothetical protein n=1 Tax=Entamoeba invadens IP1 TaxID=370355 RepID=UPI0002C3FA22|nr:hypothetical protein EIN_053430 [Entamoeba invadens IP1]ELP93098.1 hypothetical protein EIN_053430 [Entamoeba invadens IP1]|eukprot:XP_004259869.1 hypothetical protein EIN_053430 [Entamoeba invadens IP1]